MRSLSAETTGGFRSRPSTAMGSSSPARNGASRGDRTRTRPSRRRSPRSSRRCRSPGSGPDRRRARGFRSGGCRRRVGPGRPGGRNARWADGPDETAIRSAHRPDGGRRAGGVRLGVSRPNERRVSSGSRRAARRAGWMNCALNWFRGGCRAGRWYVDRFIELNVDGGIRIATGNRGGSWLRHVEGSEPVVERLGVSELATTRICVDDSEHR